MKIIPNLKITLGAEHEDDDFYTLKVLGKRGDVHGVNRVILSGSEGHEFHEGELIRLIGEKVREMFAWIKEEEKK